MRVVHLSFHRDACGRDPAALLDAWPTLVEHAAAVRRAGGDIHVVQAANRDATLHRAGVPFQFVRTEGGRLAPPRALFAALRAARPDVVHVHGLVSPGALWWLRQVFPPARTLVQDHGTRPPHGLRAIAWRRILSGMSVAFTSTGQAEAWRGAGALGRSVRSVAIPEASSTFVPGDRAAARQRTGVHGAPAVLWLGRLDANKDPLTALDGVAAAAIHRPDLRLWMAWTAGALEDAVRGRVADDPVLRARVTLLGALPHDEVRHYLTAADCLVQASHHEGSGYAVIEALACGTPVVVTDIASFRALLGDPPAGRLVPVGDAAAFGRALSEPLPARGRVADHFNRHLHWDRLGPRWVACYRQLAGGS